MKTKEQLDPSLWHISERGTVPVKVSSVAFRSPTLDLHSLRTRVFSIEALANVSFAFFRAGQGKYENFLAGWS